jgi:hypothetical protein
MRRRRRERYRPVKDWRDPDMPAERLVLVPGVVPGADRVEAKDVSPEQSSRFSRERIDNPDSPNWRRDPSYWWGKKKEA